MRSTGRCFRQSRPKPASFYRAVVLMAEIRRPVQVQVDAGGHLLCACGCRRASRSEDGGCSGACSRRTRPPKTRPISAAFRSLSGRRCCRRPRSAVFLAATLLLLRLFRGAARRYRGNPDPPFSVVGIVFFVNRLAKAVLSPSLPNWRLILGREQGGQASGRSRFGDGIVHRHRLFPVLVNETLGSPLSLTVGESLFATVIFGVLVILVGLVKPFSYGDGRPRPWPPFLRVLLFVLGGFDHPRGARRLYRICEIRLATDRGHRRHPGHHVYRLPLRPRDRRGRRLCRNRARPPAGEMFEADDPTLDQLALVVSITINLLILLICLPLILLQWGFQLGDIRPGPTSSPPASTSARSPSRRPAS